MTVANTLKGQRGRGGGGIGPEETLIAAPLSHGSNPHSNAAVRRLTPTECCRLQGFPDDWLGPPNEPPDSPRYAALGDAVTVNVAHWIGQRLIEAHRDTEERAA